MKELIFKELQSLGFPLDAVKMLYAMGHAPYVAWLSRRKPDLCLRDCGMRRKQVAYAKYAIDRVPLYELEKNREYNLVRTTLSCYFYDIEEAWDELLPYNYNHARRLCVYILRNIGWNMCDVAVALNYSYTAVYKIYKYVTKRFKDTTE